MICLGLLSPVSIIGHDPIFLYEITDSERLAIGEGIRIKGLKNI